MLHLSPTVNATDKRPRAVEFVGDRAALGALRFLPPPSLPPYLCVRPPHPRCPAAHASTGAREQKSERNDENPVTGSSVAKRMVRTLSATQVVRFCPSSTRLARRMVCTLAVAPIHLNAMRLFSSATKPRRTSVNGEASVSVASVRTRWKVVCRCAGKSGTVCDGVLRGMSWSVAVAVEPFDRFVQPFIAAHLQFPLSLLRPLCKLFLVPLPSRGVIYRGSRTALHSFCAGRFVRRCTWRSVFLANAQIMVYREKRRCC